MPLQEKVPTMAEGKLQFSRCSRAMVSSIGLVASGGAPAPSCRENLKREYSGGLWLAVMLMPPKALRRRIAKDNTGVGVSRSHTRGVSPLAAKTSAVARAKGRPRKRQS